ncbi:MAG: hypothetical protein KME31_32860 [Tolypothrix carrinoi HA7290-LM1]|nr:hypothetical protein [Tolypothrix carrinoi HA7290-LM1]
MLQRREPHARCFNALNPRNALALQRTASPMPHDGRCYNGGNLTPGASTLLTRATHWLCNALPPPCPLPHAPLSTIH